jgi:4-amino-4-deoxy-L-arabinose transferase and related glycosyltransferases of PMT family
LTAVDTKEHSVADQHTPVPGTSRVAFWLAVFTVLLHATTNWFTPYGIHRDEFLYLAMGRHLHLWRMDFPPAIALIAQFSHTLLGDSLFAIRFMPAIAAGTMVFLSATIVRHLGGDRFSQGLAALAVVCCPLFLRAGNLFQPVVFDQLAWTIALYTLVRLVQTENPKWWIWFGVAAGLGLLTKFSAIFFGTAALIAIIITPERRWFATRWPWLAILIAIVIGSPSVVGQIALGYPVLIQMRDLKAAQLDRVTPTAFMRGQLLYGPGVMLAIAGVVALIADKRLRRFSVVAWTCVFAFLILMILHGKSYYVGPIYPTLFAAGAVTLGSIPSASLRRSAQWVAVVLIVAYGAVILPLGLPILPPDRMTEYAHAIGATSALRTNQGQLDRLPQDYADMLGWPEQVAAVAKVYNSLSPADKAQAVIIADNYGEAGAIDYYGPRYGLPKVVSATGTYWFFGPGAKPGDVAVTVGVDGPTLKQFWAESQLITTVGDPWSVMEERVVPIYVSRRPFKTLQQVWPSLAGRD